MATLTWKRALIAIGALLALVGIGILAYRTGINCGEYILGLWPQPYFILALILFAIGAAVIVTGSLSGEARVKNLTQQLLLMGFSFAFTLGILEAALRLTEPPLVYETPFYENHDQLGYFFSPSASHDYLLPDWRRATFRTDEHGLIIRDGSNQPQPDAHRIMVIGDSFVEATQVMPDEAMSVLLAQELEQSASGDYQTLNTGVSGYSPLQYRFVYHQFADDFDPQTVVVMITSGNDFFDTAQLVHGDRVIYDDDGVPASLRPMIEDGMAWVDASRPQVPVEELQATLVPREVWKSGILRVLQWLLIRPICEGREFALLRAELNADGDQSQGTAEYDDPCTVCAQWVDSPIRADIHAIFKEAYSEDDLQDIDRSLDSLRLLKQDVEADGRELVIVIIPTNHQIRGQGVEQKVLRGMAADEIITSTSPQAVIMAFCTTEGIACLDLLPEFRDHDDQALYWPAEGHWTPLGHQIAAQAISEFLRK